MIFHYIQGDIRKLNFTEQLYKNKSHLLTPEVVQNIFHSKMFNEDSKRLTATLFNEYIPFHEHHIRMNDTIEQLLLYYGMKILSMLCTSIPRTQQFPFYIKFLEKYLFFRLY
jgi:hypothetical protein